MSAKPKFGTPAYDAINEKHVADPQPGDYWHEMFCPYVAILARVGNHLIVYRKRKDVPPNHWTWDTDEPSMMTLAELRKLVTYDTIDGFVADVVPGHMKDFADEFAKRLPSTVSGSRENV